MFLPENTGKQKQGKTTSRKSKSPNLAQAYSAGERPSSVSSVHSEGDYHRQAQAQSQWSWDDRPSSTGELSSDLSAPPDNTCLLPLLLKKQPAENITDIREYFWTFIKSLHLSSVLANAFWVLNKFIFIYIIYFSFYYFIIYLFTSTFFSCFFSVQDLCNSLTTHLPCAY